MEVYLLSNKDIVAHLQAVVKYVHGITVREELNKWTLHSIRVGPYVFLGEGGHESPFIKIRLH